MLTCLAIVIAEIVPMVGAAVIAAGLEKLSQPRQRK